jgi:hypothetical protein
MFYTNFDAHFLRRMHRKGPKNDESKCFNCINQIVIRCRQQKLFEQYYFVPRLSDVTTNLPKQIAYIIRISETLPVSLFGIATFG